MWDTFPKILNIILGLFTIYFYLENRKLKGFEIDKEIELKKVEIKELEMWYSQKKEELDEEMAIRGLTYSGIRKKTNANLEQEYKNKLKKLKAKLTYFERLKRYKWILSK